MTRRVVTVWCEFCGAGPDTPCTPEGQHLHRYLRAWQEGLVSRRAVSDVCAMLGSISAGALVPDPTLSMAFGYCQGQACRDTR